MRGTIGARRRVRHERRNDAERTEMSATDLPLVLALAYPRPSLRP